MPEGRAAARQHKDREEVIIEDSHTNDDTYRVKQADETEAKKTKVLFVCSHNAARSQMAEAFLNHLAGERFEAESAGIEPGELDPLAVEVMREAGIDISQKATKSVYDLHKENRQYDHVITVCDAAAGVCPVFPGFTATAHWPFGDPAGFTGTHEERLTRTRRVRDAIRKKIEEFIGLSR